MKAFSQHVILTWFAVVFLGCLVPPTDGTANLTISISNPVSPSPPYSLEDVLAGPSGSGFVPQPSWNTTSVGVADQRVPDAQPNVEGLKSCQVSRFVFHGTDGKPCVKPREPMTSLQKAIRDWRKTLQKAVRDLRKSKGMKRDCKHTKQKKPCTCGISLGELAALRQSIGEEPARNSPNLTGLGATTDIQVFHYGDSVPVLAESSSGPPYFPNFSQPVLREDGEHYVKYGKARLIPQLEDQAATNDQLCSSVPSQSEARLMTQEHLVNEVRGIYAGLIMVEKKCVEIDAQQLGNPDKLSYEQWQALIALHRTLLYEYQDFFQASQHPSSSAALRSVATRYAMPTRMWRHGIQSFLELLDRRLPDSHDHMLSFIHLARSMMRLMIRSAPTFVDTWIEYLDDLARYRAAIEEVDVRDRETWSSSPKIWYEKAADKYSNVGSISRHLALLARPNAVQQSSGGNNWSNHRYQHLPGLSTQQNMAGQPYNAENSLPEDFPIKEMMYAQHYFPESFFQRQAAICDAAMSDLPSVDSDTAWLDMPDLPSNIGEGSRVNDAPNGPESLLALLENGLNDRTESEMELMGWSVDDLLVADSPDASSMDPLNNILNLETPLAPETVESTVPSSSLPEDFTLPEMEWDQDLQMHYVRDIVESNSRLPVPDRTCRLEDKTGMNEEDNDQTHVRIVQDSEKRVYCVIDDRDTPLKKPSIVQSSDDVFKSDQAALRTSRKAFPNSTPPWNHLELSQQNDAIRANAGPEGIFLLLLMYSQRSSVGGKDMIHGGDNRVKLVQVLLLLLVFLFGVAKKL
jgi:hypothetical protein